MDLFQVKKENKHSVVALQLAPILDIFIVIIIFLVLGSFSKGVAVEVPTELKLTKATNDEIVEISSEVHLFYENNIEYIYFKFLDQKLRYADFLTDENLQNSVLEKIKKYNSSLASQAKLGGINLNFVIDEKIKYKYVFDLSEFLRNSGFENLSYISEKEYRK